MQPEQEIINRWSGSAPFWEKHRDIIRQMFAPITEALVEDGQIGRGHTVLDIATGPGEPALTVASLVGPEGKVYGVDPIPEMVAAARREASRVGLQNVEFAVGFADQLPHPANTFDAVISRFGIMFFPSPVDGVREMLRVLKPGKRLAVAVWHFAERNPFHYSLSRVMDRYVHAPPPEPDALDAFRFAEPGKLRKVFAEAGVAESTERLVRFAIETPLPAEDYWTLRIEMSDKLRGKIRALSERQVAEVKRQGIESLREYSTERGMSFPAEVLIVSGAKGRV
ncbi:MAG TPA: methyltransferase domain-containing protein [Candidatus Acidoferrum sp.]|nr:methyltransferase domain-containing protein [Candidatus Acidoferrum sp.]